MGGGIGDELVAAYNWMNQPLINLPIKLPDIHKMESGGLDGAIDSTVMAVIDHTPLKHYLQLVTGQGDALHASAQVWQDQARVVNELADELKHSAKALEANWQGAASASFGGFMGTAVGQLESMAQDMAQAGEILNNAGQECQLAEDMIVMIIREAIEWTAMTIAATALADIFTLGLATFVGGLAEGAEMTAFIARAAQVSEKLGKALEDLQKMLKELKEAGEAVKAAKGFNETRKAIKAARDLTKSFRKAGGLLKVVKAGDEAEHSWATYRAFKMGDKVVRGAAAAGVGAATGLPTNIGVTGLGKDVGAGGKDQLTSDDGLAVTSRAIDGLTGTGTPTPAPYHLPGSDAGGQTSLRQRLDALTAFPGRSGSDQNSPDQNSPGQSSKSQSSKSQSSKN